MINFAVVTVSDSSAAGKRIDLSGPALIQEINLNGWKLVFQKTIPDNLKDIKTTLLSICESKKADVILTTGGTGFSTRDVTPEATLSVLEKQAPGIAEIMRAESYKLNPNAMLSRGVAGICKNTLIINLPGSPKGALENFRIILPVLQHGIDLIKGNITQH